MSDRVESGGSLPWMVRMAWRDSRGQRRKLALFTLCIVFGIAALTAIRSFQHNLEVTVERASRSLLGADLRLSSLRQFDNDTETFIDSLGGEQTREVSFRSMAFFPKGNQTRLVQIRALDGPFPFYGEMETIPRSAASGFLSSETPLAVVEEGLLVQFNLQHGDTMRLGEVTFTIAGALRKVSGEAEIRGLFTPRLYIHRRYLEDTGLIQRGSLISYRVYFRFEDGLTPTLNERLARARKGVLAESRVRVDTVEKRKRRIGRTMDNLYSFMNLIGFVALILGGMGVAAAVQVYLKDKLGTVAVLRCLGVEIRFAFGIYLLQVLAVGFAGAVLGALLGVVMQVFVPSVLSGFLPFEVKVFLSWPSIILSILFGGGLTVLFALIPLLPVRAATPLRALRVSFEEMPGIGRDRLFWIVLGALALVVSGFCVSQTSRWYFGFGFFFGLSGCLLILAGLSAALRWALRRYFTKGWPYAWKLGVSSLYRPNNRTLLLCVTLGMATFLIFTIFLTQDLLLRQMRFSRGDDRPNIIIFDIQPDQKEGVARIVEGSGYPVKETVPIVTMRISSINGRSAREIRNDPCSAVEGWTLRWEYRSTYRSHLTDTEEIIAGVFSRSWTGEGRVPLSIEESIAEDLDVWLGDEIEFNLQGVPVDTVVRSVRKVDWAQLRPNFYMLLPEGVLEEAPTFFALVTRVPDRIAMVDLQYRVVSSFANVSAIDLSLVLETLTEIFDRVGVVIRFMAMFTVATGVVVLASTIVTSRHQRIQESVLLCALGASGGFIRKMMSIEFLLLGALASVVGTVLAYGAAWALARFVFEISPEFSFIGVPFAVAIVSLVTLATGLLSSRGVARYPPLAVLRQEG